MLIKIHLTQKLKIKQANSNDYTNKSEYKKLKFRKEPQTQQKTKNKNISQGLNPYTAPCRNKHSATDLQWDGMIVSVAQRVLITFPSKYSVATSLSNLIMFSTKMRQQEFQFRTFSSSNFTRICRVCGHTFSDSLYTMTYFYTLVPWKLPSYFMLILHIYNKILYNLYNFYKTRQINK